MKMVVADAHHPPLPPVEVTPVPAIGLLPYNLWEHIFSFLSVSNLVVSSAVCRHWASIIWSSPFCSLYAASFATRCEQLDDLHFFLFADVDAVSPSAAAYRPSRDRWVAFPLPLPLRRVHASGGALVLAEQRDGSLMVYDLFAGKEREIGPISSLEGQSYALGLIDDAPGFYKIVAVSTLDRVTSHVFDSRTRSWSRKGDFLGRFAVLGNSVCLHGIMYCLTRAPDRLLAFELESGEWSLVDVAMPSSCLICCHVLAYGGSLFLIGGEEEGGDIHKIVVWELDREEKRWKELGIMPDDLFKLFRGQRMDHFYIVDRKGVICFCNTSSYDLLLCDIRGMRWWWPRKCPFPISTYRQSWLGHALEPQLRLSCPRYHS